MASRNWCIECGSRCPTSGASCRASRVPPGTRSSQPFRSRSKFARCHLNHLVLSRRFYGDLETDVGLPLGGGLLRIFDV